MKKFLKKLFFRPWLARKIVLFGLRLHNFAYKLVSVFAPVAEQNQLHPKHRIMRYHAWFVSQIDADWTVLDVGCGNGALTASLRTKAKRVVGIDINPKNVEAARRRSPDGEFICGDATSYVFNETVDAVVLSNVLEHIQRRVDFLRALSQKSRRFLIRVPMISRDWIVPYKRELGVDYRLDATHYTEYTIEEFESELAAAGLTLVSKDIRWGELYAQAERLVDGTVKEGDQA